MTQLPDKPSAVIRLAVDDLEKCEGDERYGIDMSEWHLPTYMNGKCMVCLAGAVMSQTLGFDLNDYSDPDFIDDINTRKKMFALNDFRTGHIAYALDRLGFNLPFEILARIDVAEYEDNPTQFKSDMRAMADMLEAHGL